jgi:hypothetical protein
MREKLQRVAGVALFAILLGFSCGCSQWQAASEEARETAKRCSIQPTAPGCAEAGWGRPGMGP